METLVSSSLSSRSRRLREVTNWPSRPENGDVLMVNVMAMVGSSIWMRGSGSGILDAGHRIADGDALHAGDRQNVARTAHRFVHALQPFKRIQLGDLRVVERAVDLRDGNLVAVVQHAVEHAANRQPAQIIAVIEIRHQNLQRGCRDRPPAAEYAR